MNWSRLAGRAARLQWVARTMTAGQVIELDPSEAAAIAAYAGALADRYESSESAELYRDLPLLAHAMPPTIKQTLNGFRLNDDEGYLLVKGHAIDDRRIGPTPGNWRGRPPRNPAFEEELALLLYGALLGDPFGWRTQQDGRLVHEVFPIKGDEESQLGTGSLTALTWHTEDAFHPFGADYLLLMGLRNPDRVPTTVGHLDVGALDGDIVDTLFSERFIIAPDNSHLAANNSAGAADEVAFAEIERMLTAPEPMAVLRGARTSPYLRIDPYFMSTLEGDVEAERALAAAVDVIDRSMADVVIEPGDILILDNLRVVHGRRPFRPRYDGADRWLKRINVTRDLRRSAAKRAGPSCRLVG